jgi:hypothetical protein
VTVRIVVALTAFAVLAGVAWWLERRRRTDPPTQSSTALPAQLDRRDFARPDAPWLVALFTSANCTSCAGLIDKATPLESPEVAVTELEFPDARTLHDRYHIAAAPTTLVADADGVVRASIIGAFSTTELWSTVSDARG